MSQTLRAQQRIDVTLSGGEPRHYAIVVQSGLLNRLGEECRAVLPKDARILAVTDTHIANRYLPTVEGSLKAAGFQVETLVVPAGEGSKSLEQSQVLYEAALRMHLSRKDAFLGLGGGVIGDLTGFCASTYHRGANVIHVPTTLVAQVDSAIGGKTAVNFGHVKNIVGTFHQPRLVLADPDLLASLSAREFAAGMAEVIKYGLIETSCDGGTGFWEELLGWGDASAIRENLSAIIHRCAAIKAAVVMEDELETKGLRHFLNLGHTFGHAYETLSQYGLLHGEAVAIGTVKAVHLSVELGLLPAEVLQALHRLLQAVDLSACLQRAADFAPDALLDVMKQDKKNNNEQIRLILPSGPPGQVVARDDIPSARILQALATPIR
jgi:3-dehydroquinate synthase